MCATEIYFADISGYLSHSEPCFMHVICEKKLKKLCVFYFCATHNSDIIWGLCRSLYGRRRRHLWHILSLFNH